MSDRGRPKSAESRMYTKVQCRLNRNEFEKLDALSEKMKTNRADIIRMAIDRMAESELESGIENDEFYWDNLDGDYISPEEADLMDDEW